MTELRKQKNGWIREMGGALRRRSFWVCCLSLALAAIICFISEQIHMVYILDGNTSSLRYTLRKEPQKILQDHGIVTMAFDSVDFSGFEGKMGVISIERAFSVTVTADGRTREVMTPEVTVAQMLESQGIMLGEYDEISLSPRLYLSPGDRIVIKRVNLETTVIRESLPFATRYVESSLLRPGRSRTLVEGVEGEKTITYTDRVVDGVLEERAASQTEQTRAPKDRVVLRGAAGVPVSSLDFGVPLDANGVPLHYKKVLTNQVATGYSARAGARGASGQRLSYGSVAVRADDIPYGSKLYIASPDGSFVYGFAVAADTGTGLMQGVIDVDLFYETYNESALNGRKTVNIYVLE